ncbi:MAG: heme-binding domain-containing protein [Planctomycetes bacterium]|nr:heme-binding domain-containing protein [Planctomycetota bacterium]
MFFVIDLFVVIQFIPVNRDNPEVTGEIEVPADVMAILQRSCYDCHSNETVWPWYSYVAPASWLIARDVHKGREELNFSDWTSYNTKQKNHKRKECGEEVEEGEMPLWFYIPLHSEAELLPKDVEAILRWSRLE